MCNKRGLILKRYFNKYSLKEWTKDESGLVVVEYIIGAAGLLILVGLLFANFGTSLLSKLTSILDLL